MMLWALLKEGMRVRYRLTFPRLFQLILTLNFISTVVKENIAKLESSTNELEKKIGLTKDLRPVSAGNVVERMGVRTLTSRK